MLFGCSSAKTAAFHTILKCGTGKTVGILISRSAVHELQNHYLDMTKVHLEKPWLKSHDTQF